MPRTICAEALSVTWKCSATHATAFLPAPPEGHRCLLNIFCLAHHTVRRARCTSPAIAPKLLVLQPVLSIAGLAKHLKARRAPASCGRRPASPPGGS
jgi:hypothetical protein